MIPNSVSEPKPPVVLTRSGDVHNRVNSQTVIYAVEEPPVTALLQSSDYRHPWLANLVPSQMTVASFAPASPAQAITAREQVDKKALLTHLAAQIRTAQSRLEQCERQQDSSRVAEIFFQKLAYEDLQQRIMRGEFDCSTTSAQRDEP